VSKSEYTDFQFKSEYSPSVAIIQNSQSNSAQTENQQENVLKNHITFLPFIFSSLIRLREAEEFIRSFTVCPILNA